jgi:hypothetical protein
MKYLTSIIATGAILGCISLSGAIADDKPLEPQNKVETIDSTVDNNAAIPENSANMNHDISNVVSEEPPITAEPLPNNAVPNNADEAKPSEKDGYKTESGYGPVAYDKEAAQSIDPEALAQKKQYAVDKIVKVLKKSKECGKVYTAKIKTASGEQTLVICEEKRGDHEPLYKINIDDMCEVSLHEKFGMFEWLRGDDVAVRTKHGVVSTMRFWDKPAKKVYEALNEYVQLNNARCEYQLN